MSYVLLQLHCFLASLSFQFILKCTTDRIFIELKLTWVCDWFIHPSTTLLCDPIYCGLLVLSCVIQCTAAFLRFLVWSNLYCRLLALSCVIQSILRLLALSCAIQSTAAFLRFLVQSNLLPPSCAFLCNPIYCRLLVLSCMVQSIAAFLHFLVWSNLLPPSCAFLCNPIYCCLFVCLIQATATFLHFLVRSTPICQRLLVCQNSASMMTRTCCDYGLMCQNSASITRICCNYVQMRTKIQHSWWWHVATMPKFSIHEKDMLRLRFDVCQNSASMAKTF
jgi:hypothetical protein